MTLAAIAALWAAQALASGGERLAPAKVVPLPIYSTLPNEGSTYGFMPVFLVVENGTQRTESIFAPSVSWNRIIRFTHTFRWYHYPSQDESLTLIPSLSSHVNRGLTFEYLKLPRPAAQWTFEAALHFRRSIFYRFFGIGPETRSGDESSYTRLGGDAGMRLGLNLTREFNIGARIALERQLLERRHVDFLPLTHDRHPGAPGLGGATTLHEGLSLRYDTRDAREYSGSGFFTELAGGVAQGLAGADAFERIQWETRGLWEETSFLQGAARLHWSHTYGRNVPFYHQSSLGGSFRLRGFTEDRFIDRGAWEVELEQRLTLFKTHIYGVTADWRVDPFVAIGQVYDSAGSLFRHARVSGGLGFRAFVQPNVLGRVDAAVGGEGVKVYVELGYPF